MRSRNNLLAAFAFALALAGCGEDMRDGSRLKPYEPSGFFADGMSARPRVEGTVARGELREDAHLYTGRVDGALATTFPFPMGEADLRRGQERYRIFCAVCHGAAGEGDGMVVRRGFTRPPTLHSERLRAAAPGHFFDVMTSGFGRMPDYRDPIPAEDRWRIAAYVRALQLSRRATLDDVPPGERAALEKETA